MRWKWIILKFINEKSWLDQSSGFLNVLRYAESRDGKLSLRDKAVRVWVPQSCSLYWEMQEALICRLWRKNLNFFRPFYLDDISPLGFMWDLWCPDLAVLSGKSKSTRIRPRLQPLAVETAVSKGDVLYKDYQRAKQWIGYRQWPGSRGWYSGSHGCPGKTEVRPLLSLVLD